MTDISYVALACGLIIGACIGIAMLFAFANPFVAK